MRATLSLIVAGLLATGLAACDANPSQPNDRTEAMEGGGRYPAPSPAPTAIPTDPAATQSINETQNLAPMTHENASGQAIPSPAPGSRTGEDVAQLRVDKPLTSGSETIIGSLAALAVLGAIVLIGAILARRRGYLQSRGSQIAVIVVVAILAAVAWLVPSIIQLA